MTEREPVEVTNLDRYGSAALPWSRPRDILAAGPSAAGPGNDWVTFLGTSRPDGRPHAAGIGALWHDGDFYIASGPDTRKSRNLAANPACTISLRVEGMDLVFEGEAARVTDPPTLEEVAARYRDGGWPPGTAKVGGPQKWMATRSPLPSTPRAPGRRHITSTA